MQLKYSNYVAFSHFHGKAVNNSGLILTINNKCNRKSLFTSQNSHMRRLYYF